MDGRLHSDPPIGRGLLADGPEVHQHELPSSEGLRPGAVAACFGCGKFFVLDPIPWEQTWRSVHWWDRRAKRAIAARMRP